VILLLYSACGPLRMVYSCKPKHAGEGTTVIQIWYTRALWW